MPSNAHWLAARSYENTPDPESPLDRMPSVSGRPLPPVGWLKVVTMQTLPSTVARPANWLVP